MPALQDLVDGLVVVAHLLQLATELQHGVADSCLELSRISCAHYIAGVRLNGLRIKASLLHPRLELTDSLIELGSCTIGIECALHVDGALRQVGREPGGQRHTLDRGHDASPFGEGLHFSDIARIDTPLHQICYT